MKKQNKKQNPNITEMLNFIVEDYSKFQRFIKRLRETEEHINHVYDTDLDERIEKIIAKNPNNKNIQSILTFTQNINQKHKFDKQARIIYATEVVKEYKKEYDLDLRNEFEVVDGRFMWQREIREIM